MLECKDVRPFLAEYEAGTLPEEQAALVLIAAIVVAVLYTPKPADDPVDPDFGLPPAGNGQIQPRTAGVVSALSLCAHAQGVA